MSINMTEAEMKLLREQRDTLTELSRGGFSPSTTIDLGRVVTFIDRVLADQQQPPEWIEVTDEDTGKTLSFWATSVLDAETQSEGVDWNEVEDNTYNI